MAGFYNRISVQDILNAGRDIKIPELYQESYRHQLEGHFGESKGIPRHVNDVGINYNEWRRPVREFGPGDTELQRDIDEHRYLKDFNVDPRDWKKSIGIVKVLLENLLLKALNEKAEKYKGLSLRKFVKQGSSREGLKVGKADEFDTVLLFDITGLNIEPVNMEAQPGLGFLKVRGHHNKESLKTYYPKLERKGVFTSKESDIYLNSRHFHESVFISLIDSAIKVVGMKINEAGSSVGFKIKRQMNAPSINLTFILTSTNPNADARHDLYKEIGASAAHIQNEGAQLYQIDVDVVPGFQILLDRVPNPFKPQESMDCPVYAVFKWRDEKQRSALVFKDPEVIWRFCTSGYEKHIMDVAQTKPGQNFILTACRLVKAYINGDSVKPTQFGRFMKSYYLKNIAMYCILYVTILNSRELSGVREALGYFLDFLEVSLEEKTLPHFFYCNEWIKYMFPDYEPVEGKKVDLYESAHKRGHLVNARESQWRDIKRDLQSLCQPGMIIYGDFKERFREFITAGGYCTTYI